MGSPTMWTMRRLSSGGIDESDAMGTGSGGSTDIRVSNEDERHHGFRLPFFMRRGKILCDQPQRAQVDPTTSLNFDFNSKKKPKPSIAPKSLPLSSTRVDDARDNCGHFVSISTTLCCLSSSSSPGPTPSQGALSYRISLATSFPCFRKQLSSGNPLPIVEILCQRNGRRLTQLPLSSLADLRLSVSIPGVIAARRFYTYDHTRLSHIPVTSFCP